MAQPINLTKDRNYKYKGQIEYNFVYQDYLDEKHTGRSVDREGYAQKLVLGDTVYEVIDKLRFEMNSFLADTNVAGIKFNISIFIS